MIQAVLWGDPQGHDALGVDLCVANAARASFGKFKTVMDEKDENLIDYLTRGDNEHTTPFRHNFVRFSCRAPIFVARQLAKHQVGLAWSETSLRYVKAGDVWHPTEWREQSENKKQGSGGALENQAQADLLYDLAVSRAVEAYDRLLDLGVCREQARAVLPTGVYTEWKWSGTLQAWAHMCKLRCAPDAQAETRELAEQIRAELIRIWPHAMAALGVTAE
jgi:thymidylate synthase (FAD)